ncbi:MAG: DUF2752 domain-containing protein [Oscillospiraceae bacterium]|nr:DUF2752 domain-containing protein [Oscillospiraceae bacterium]
MKRRAVKVITIGTVCLVTGCAYALLCRALGFGIPCVFHLVTGLQCPGCGVSRMFISLLSLDFAAALRYNAAVLCLLPIGVAVAADYAVVYIKYGAKTPHRWAELCVWLMIGVLVAFGALRNLI